VTTRPGPGPDDRELAKNPLQAHRRRNRWIWVSAALGLVAAGLLIWGLNVNSDLDSAKQQNKELQAQVSDGKQAGSDAAASYKNAYDHLESELGTTKADLSKTEQQLDDAQKDADQAEQDLKAAQKEADQAQTGEQKAQAQAKEAQAQADAAESKTSVAASCANAYVTEVGSLLESPDPTAQVETAKQELQGIVDDCKAALGTE
jgi:chromosome segregation ATPase